MQGIKLFLHDVMANIASFKTLPGRVKYAIIYLIGSWIWHYLTIYIISKTVTFDQRSIIQMCVIGPVLIMFVFSMRNWARVLCVLSQSLAICLYLFLSVGLTLGGNQQYATMSAINLALFSVSIYFLMHKETRDYVKARDNEIKEKRKAEAESNK